MKVLKIAFDKRRLRSLVGAICLNHRLTKLGHLELVTLLENYQNENGFSNDFLRHLLDEN